MLTALSPVHWTHARLLTEEMPYLTHGVRDALYWFFFGQGFDVNRIPSCDEDTPWTHQSLRWQLTNRCGWFCSNSPLMLLGLVFRGVAFMQLVAAPSKPSRHVFRLQCVACVLVLAGFLTLHVWLLGLPKD